MSNQIPAGRGSSRSEQNERAIRQRQRALAERKRKRQQRNMIAVILVIAVIVVLVVLLIVKRNSDLKAAEASKASAEVAANASRPEKSASSDSSHAYAGISSQTTTPESEAGETEPADVPSEEVYETPEPTPVVQIKPIAAAASNDQLYSSHALMVRTSDWHVLLDKGGYDIFFPASITKIMTVLVCLEQLDPETPITISYDLDIAPCYELGASFAGFDDGETVPAKDLYYAAMLPSGADACYALARTVAGSEAGFAELMNQKAAELGMNFTHFVTVTGLHDDNHYSTCNDMAILLNAALQDPFFREIAGTESYRCTPTEQHPEGLVVSSTVGYVIGGQYYQENGAHIEGGKTGYTEEAGRCLASYGTYEGEEVILVTFGAPENYDTAEVYSGTDALTCYSSLYLGSEE